MSRYVQKEHVTAEELMAMIEAAHAELSALCAGKRFRMCIPVEADDSDVVIGDALRHSLRFVKAASASSSVPEKWQSIETAPKDGGRSSVVILSDGRFVWTGYFAKRWYPVWVDAPEPTHWQPLPAPPVSSPVNKEPAPMNGEMNMVIGRMHIKDGFVAERTPDAERPIRIGLSHGGDPFNTHTPVVWCDFTESEFASVVAHVARRGETGDTFREALGFLQATGIEDDDAATSSPVARQDEKP